MTPKVGFVFATFIKNLCNKILTLGVYESIYHANKCKILRYYAVSTGN